MVALRDVLDGHHLDLRAGTRAGAPPVAGTKRRRPYRTVPAGQGVFRIPAGPFDPDSPSAALASCAQEVTGRWS